MQKLNGNREVVETAMEATAEQLILVEFNSDT
jgi:hypothetical protein